VILDEPIGHLDDPDQCLYEQEEYAISNPYYVLDVPVDLPQKPEL
jgi:hypothetical protein